MLYVMLYHVSDLGFIFVRREVIGFVSVVFCVWFLWFLAAVCCLFWPISFHLGVMSVLLGIVASPFFSDHRFHCGTWFLFFSTAYLRYPNFFLLSMPSLFLVLSVCSFCTFFRV